MISFPKFARFGGYNRDYMYLYPKPVLDTMWVISYIVLCGVKSTCPKGKNRLKTGAKNTPPPSIKAKMKNRPRAWLIN